MGLKPLSDIEIIKIDSALRMFHLEILMDFFLKALFGKRKMLLFLKYRLCWRSLFAGDEYPGLY